jgi:hypothetical protein
LRFHDLGVGRAGLKQFVVSSETDTSALIKYKDLVGVLNRCDSLGNDDERRVGGDRQ